MIVTKKKPDLKVFYLPDSGNGKPLDPYAVLNDFFDDYTLEDIRLELWALLKAALGDAEDNSPAHFVFLYEKLHDLCTASYMLAESKQSERPKKKPIKKRK